MLTRKSVCDALDNQELILKVIGMFSSKGNANEFRDVAITFTANEHERLWNTLLSISSNSITKLRLDEEEEGDNEAARDQSIGIAANEEELVQHLRNIASIANVYAFDLPQYRPASLLETVTNLHNTLIPLDESIHGAQQLKVNIARICEHWWVSEQAGAESLVPQLLPYLLICSLAPDAFDSDVKRVFAVREALLLLDFEDESIGSLKGLLLRCYLHPTFLKVPEGRKFLAFLFSVSKGLHSLILGVMKPQLATGIKSIAESYGEIIYRAWKDAAATGEILNLSAVEDCIQILIHDAIHAADPKYFRGLQVALNVLHEGKKHKGVDSMLLRVYEPIIFRSLRCANGIVRAHASELFFGCFPLQNEDASTSEIDDLLQKQFDLFVALLKDTDQRVRAVAASGICRVLRVFWEVLPSATKHSCLSYLVGTLGQDASSAVVRLAVIQGLTELLDQPLSHPAMKKMLALMSHSIHDNTEKVRIAFVQLLVKVKLTRGILFYDIVPVEHLFFRMAEDRNRPAMCIAMVELLQESLLPQAEDLDATERSGSSTTVDNASVDAEHVKRCLRLIESHPLAAECFYTYAHRVVGLKASAKLAVLLFALVNTTSPLTSKTAKPQKRSRGATEIHEPVISESNGPEKDDSMDTQTKQGVLVVVEAILESIKVKLLSKSKASQTACKLLLGMITPDAINGCIDTIAATDGVQSLEMTALLLRLQAFVANIGGTNDTHQAMLSAQKLLTQFHQVWEVTSVDNSETERQGLAVAVVRAVSALGATEMLVQTICNSFAELSSPHQMSKTSGSGKQKKVQSKHNLPVDAAVAILSALVESNQCEPTAASSSSGERPWNQMESLTNLFQVIPSVARRILVSFQDFATASSAVVDTDSKASQGLIRSVHLWSSISLMMDMNQSGEEQIAVNLSAVLEFVNEMLKGVISNWLTILSLPATKVQHSVSECMRMSTAVLSVVSDGLMLQFAPIALCQILSDLASQLAGITRLIVYQPSFDATQSTSLADTQVLLSAVARVCSALGTKCDEQLAANGSNVLQAFADVLLVPLELVDSNVKLISNHRLILGKTMSILSTQQAVDHAQFKVGMDTFVKFILKEISNSKDAFEQLDHNDDNSGENQAQNNSTTPESFSLRKLLSNPGIDCSSFANFVEKMKSLPAAQAIVRALQRRQSSLSDNEAIRIWAEYIKDCVSSDTGTSPALQHIILRDIEEMITSTPVATSTTHAVATTRTSKRSRAKDVEVSNTMSNDLASSEVF